MTAKLSRTRARNSSGDSPFNSRTTRLYGKDLQLRIGKQDALKEVVFFVADIRKSLFLQLSARAAGAGRAMMTVGDVEIRELR